jgi:general secretion pathway protein A
MYQRFYGFAEMPFSITPDPKFLYLSPTHLDALEHLKFGLDERKGFIVLVGEVGCGKTTLCRRLLNELDPRYWDTALILNPRLSETDMLRAILRELGDKRPARTPHELVNQINRRLLARIDAGKDIVLIIDEAQNLSFEVLEQIRLLSNLETDNQKLLQIILMGQPELKEILGRQELRQLRQRILIHYELKPLSMRDLTHYVHHRVPSLLAGRSGSCTAFREAFPGWSTIYVIKHSWLRTCETPMKWPGGICAEPRATSVACWSERGTHCNLLLASDFPIFVVIKTRKRADSP